jgi:hypothetical protein
MIWSHSPYVYQEENEEIEERIVRFRTVGDMSCTAAVDSYATTSEVVGEIRFLLYLKEVLRRQTFRGSDGEKKTTRVL